MLSNCMLLLAGAIWGGGFVVSKNALDNFGPNYLLAIRFTIGALGLAYSLVLYRHRLTKRTVIGGAVTGALICMAYVIQTYGLMFTTAGKNALLTAVYVVLTPLFSWWIEKRRPKAHVLIAGGIMLAGIALLSLNESFSIGFGDGLTLICSIAYALHIIAVHAYSSDSDVMQLTCLQFAFAAVFSWILALALETPPGPLTGEMVWEITYCGVGSTLVALTLMNIGVKYASPEYASLFMSTEAGFGCLFGVIFLHEAMTSRMLLGCVLVLIALALSQIDIKEMLTKRKAKTDGQ